MQVRRLTATSQPSLCQEPGTLIRWLIVSSSAERLGTIDRRGDAHQVQARGELVCQRTSLVDKGKPDASRGRKATGPTRSAELPNGKKRIMRKSSEFLGALAVAGLIAAGGSPERAA